jgi:cytochrome c peroxidase
LIYICKLHWKTVFNNLYFSLLGNLKWTPNEKVLSQGGKFQYQDPSGKLMMLPSDIALIEDPKFKQFVDVYAKDQKKFFTDFAAAFQKLEELGTNNLYDV